MNKVIQITETADIEEKIAKLRQEDIAYSEQGEANGFHEANEAKERTLDYLERLINELKKFSSKLNTSILNDSLTKIERKVKEIQDYVAEIRKLVDEGVNKETFPDQRKQKTDQMKAAEINAKHGLHALELDLKLEAIKKTLVHADLIDQTKAEMEAVLAESRKYESEISKILNNLRGPVMQMGVQESRGTFHALSRQHANTELYWLIGVALSAVTALSAFACIVFFDLGGIPDEVPQAIGLLMKRLIAISAPLVFLKLCLTKFNLERNLHIVYNHRESVLKEYKNFESAIGDDVAAKNAFRLEIAKYIFSDPQTGYLGEKDNSEINVNPIINMAEKMARG